VRSIRRWRWGGCPICGQVQTPEDFRQYKDRGATPARAYRECIGRYRESCRKAIANGEWEGQPCDYAAYGLFKLGAVVVEGISYPVFDFDRSGER
jgi:hypothetical protein